MEFEISRLDHHGVVSGVIKDLGLIDQIDRLLGVHDQSQVSHGEAIAGMILNGFGFTDRPLSISPQFSRTRHWEFCFAREWRPRISIVSNWVAVWTRLMLTVASASLENSRYRFVVKRA